MEGGRYECHSRLRDGTTLPDSRENLLQLCARTYSGYQLPRACRSYTLFMSTPLFTSQRAELFATVLNTCS